MDGLIAILIIAGLAAFRSSRKQKQAQEKAARKANAYKTANEAIDQAKEKIPFAREEWISFLKEQAQTEPARPRAVPAKPAVQPAKSAAQPARAKAKAKKAATAPKACPSAPAPVLHIAHDAPEGSVSTQGESAEEHAKHRERILAEEEKLRQTQQTLQAVRSLNRQKLQNAVVMSEILDKPVSLRPGRYR